MITEVDTFKEEGLVTPERGEGEKGILKINLLMQGILTPVACAKGNTEGPCITQILELGKSRIAQTNVHNWDFTSTLPTVLICQF